MSSADAWALLARLRAAGFQVELRAGRLRVQPASGLTAELRAEIAGNKVELVELLARAPPAGRIRVNEGVDLRDDPRPDLVQDSVAWASVIAAATELNYEDGLEVSGVLYGVRSLGARIVPADHGWRIVRPEDMGLWEWEDLREIWLVRHRAALRKLLQTGDVQAASPHTQA